VIDADVKWFPLDLLRLLTGYLCSTSFPVHMVDSPIVISRSGFILSHGILYSIHNERINRADDAKTDTTYSLLTLSLPVTDKEDSSTSYLIFSHYRYRSYTQPRTRNSLPTSRTYFCSTKIITNYTQWRLTRTRGPCPMAGSHSKPRTFTKYVHRSNTDSTKATKHGST
jgi:hypothetical protein